MKKALGGDANTAMRAGCSKAESKIFAPPQTLFPGARESQNLIGWKWSLPLPSVREYRYVFYVFFSDFKKT